MSFLKIYTGSHELYNITTIKKVFQPIQISGGHVLSHSHLNGDRLTRPLETLTGLTGFHLEGYLFCSNH